MSNPVSSIRDHSKLPPHGAPNISNTPGSDGPTTSQSINAPKPVQNVTFNLPEKSADQKNGSIFKTDNNLPQLVPPEKQIDSIDLIRILKLIQIEITFADLSSGRLNAENLHMSIEEKHAEGAEMQKNINSQTKKNTEQAETQKVIGKVTTCVAAVSAIAAMVLTFLTGGFAAIFLALLSTALALYSMAVSFVPQELLGTRKNAYGEDVPKDISITGLVDWLCDLVGPDSHLVINGAAGVTGIPKDASPEEKRKAFEITKLIMQIFVVVLLALPSIILGVVGIVNVAKEGLTLASRILLAASPAIARGIIVATNTLQLAIALISIGLAVSAIFLACNRRETGNLKVSRERIQKAIVEMENRFDVNNQHFKNAVNFQETIRQILAKAIQDNAEQSFRISRNCA